MRNDARRHAAGAIETLAQVMGDLEAPPAARVSAANAILDRGWGRPGTRELVQDDDPLAAVSDAALDQLIDVVRREMADR